MPPSPRTRAGSRRSRWRGTRSGRTRTREGVESMIMRAHHVAGVVAVVLLLAPVGKAQQPPAATTPQASPSRPQAKTSPPSAEPLGVSLKSIRRQLKDAPKTKKGSGTGTDSYKHLTLTKKSEV